MMNKNEKYSLIIFALLVVMIGLMIAFDVVQAGMAILVLLIIAVMMIWMTWGMILIACGGDPVRSTGKFCNFIKEKLSEAFKS